MNQKQTIIGRHYETGRAVRIDVSQERIVAICDDASISSSNGLDGLPWVAPGFVDIQINGHGGRDFNDSRLTVEDVAKISLAQDQYGVTGYCPTTTTHAFDVLHQSMKTLGKAIETVPEVARRVTGIHLEGPYISPEDGPRGAHPLVHVRPPDWDEFQRLNEAAGGRIRIVTLSAEYDGSADFIRRATKVGVVIAIGHTAATSDQIKAAVDAGARFSTHLGNGAHPRIKRHPNYIWDQLADDRLWATLIVDGHHLPPSVVKSFVRAKTAERCLIVSDITGMAGMPPGRYDNTTLGGVEVLENGKLVVAGQRDILAGAALPIGVAVPNVMKFAGVSLASAIEMTSIRPAQLIGVPVTRLEVGAVANLLLFSLIESSIGEQSLRVDATFNQGERVFAANASVGN